MIPQLPRDQTCSTLLGTLFRKLQEDGFEGVLSTSESSRVLAANDNSIWEQMPSAVIAPRTTDDIALLLKFLATPEYQQIKITPRGGGTSTAGQSLTENISLDCKRFLHHIKDFNAEKKQITVECGVVLADVNKELAIHNLMLGPTVATADRATIGGMIGNDSAGKGSIVYGKMSDCVVSLCTVLRGGEVWNSSAIDKVELEKNETISGVVGDIHREIKRACDTAEPFLKEYWPNLPRFVSGYNLPMAWDGETFNLNRIICGSEGTLGVVTEATLQCVDIPASQQLVVVSLSSFDAALRCGASIATLNPSAVEVVDELVLESARKNAPLCIDENSSALLCIECKNGSEILESILHKDGVLSGTLLKKEDEIEQIWRFRNQSVGLLSSSGKNKRPVPFVEDCAVPPEKLADFICDFRSLLDKHDLRAGMFGHVDAGVIHVRPALDLCSQNDLSLIRTVTDAVANLVRLYGGILWGEHGKGFRSEYGPEIFGNGLWEQICRVKAAFDPTNQFNPEKVAAPTPNHPLVSLDSKTRGSTNNKIAQLPILTNSIRCDGNSQCESVKFDESMCPTYRLNGDPRQSPRGRAEILRHWLHRIGGRKISTKGSWILQFFNQFAKDDFSHSVFDALHSCIGCKACATQCPMEIDIPQMRSEFLSYYYSRYPRPIRDFIWSRMEGFLKFKSTRVGNFLMHSSLSKAVGIVDVPKISSKIRVHTSSVEEIKKGKLDVVLLQDSFTTYFRPQVMTSFIRIVSSLGLNLAVLPIRPCGKALHVRGKLRTFHAVAHANVCWLEQLQGTNIPIVGIDPAATLLWREEYPKVLSLDPIKVLLPQEWLIGQDLSRLEILGNWKLFLHCNEQSLVKNSGTQWQQIFERAGSNLEIVKTACCGMGGIFGHEKEHKKKSISIWNQSWGKHNPTNETSLTTGYSCQVQASRIEHLSLRHPLEIIGKS
jgi:FAD/FMN-containing dehydrogenase/Fe-S oxidoreductase